MAEKKHSELYILKILTMYTDEDHVLSRKEIMNILKKEYGIEMDRRHSILPFMFCSQCP